MNSVLVIGYGNHLRSDDGIGWNAALALSAQRPDDRIRVEAAHQLLPEMAAWIAEARHVIFVDACWDAAPGQIRVRTIEAQTTPLSSMAHYCSPATLLSDARTLFGRAPDATLVSMGAATFDYGEQLSAPVQAAFPEILQILRRLIWNELDAPQKRKDVQHA